MIEQRNRDVAYHITIAVLLSAVIAISPIATFFVGGIGTLSAGIELTVILAILSLVASQSPHALRPNTRYLLCVVGLVTTVLLAEFAHVSQQSPFRAGEFGYSRRGAVILLIALVMFVGSALRSSIRAETTWIGVKVACLAILTFSIFGWYQATGLQVTLNAPRTAEYLIPDQEFVGANLFTLFALFAAVTALFFKSLAVRLPILVYSLALAISFGSRNTLFAIVGAYAAYSIIRLLHEQRFSHWFATAYAICGAIAIILIFVPGTLDWILNTVLDLGSTGRGTASGFTGRTEIWARIAAWWWQSPIVGNGFRTSPEYLHNGYLQVLGELGILGLVWFLFLLGTAAWHAFKQSHEREFAALFAYIVAFALYNLFESRPMNASNAFTIGFYFLASYAIAPRSSLRGLEDATDNQVSATPTIHRNLP